MLFLDWASILAPSPGLSELPSNGGDHRVGVARAVSDPAAVFKGLGKQSSPKSRSPHSIDLIILNVIWRECSLLALADILGALRHIRLRGKADGGRRRTGLGRRSQNPARAREKRKRQTLRGDGQFRLALSCS